MSFFKRVLLFALVGVLTGGIITIPFTAFAQQPITPWPTFQIDKQLALQLPAFPRQVADNEEKNQKAQSYVIQNPQASWIISREELPAIKPLSDLPIFYTSLVQAMLTHWKAVGIQQSSFRVDSLEGLTMDFRVVKPVPEEPASGTLWILKVKRTIYLVQRLTQQPDNPTGISQKQRFLASWQLTQLPVNQPTVADFARFRVGQFQELSLTSSATTIMRTDTAQTETNTGLNLRIVYGLKWNETGYDLTQRNSNSVHAAIMQPKIIHVRITAVQGDTYWYWATIGDFISTGQIQRVK